MELITVMNSEAIQNHLYEWALNKQPSFTAPYGILSSQCLDSKGKKYRSVTFGYSRTRDFEVMIYNRNFIVFRDSKLGTSLFKNFSDLSDHLLSV